MKGFKEEKMRGSAGYPFEKYNIISHTTREFATHHWHDELEIIHVEKGTINIDIAGESYEGGSGDVFIINSGEMHEIFGKSSPLKYTAFVFDPKMLAFKYADKHIESVIKGEILFVNKVENAEESFEILKTINNLNEDKGNCFELLTKAAILNFFARVINDNMFVLNNKQVDGKNKLLKEIILYIEENFEQEMSLTQIANQFNMSHKYFCRFFKRNFKKTFVEYLNDVRIEKAMALLDKGMTVTETALQCGFSNMSYFTLVFKRKLGCTPSQYRKEKLHP